MNGTCPMCGETVRLKTTNKVGDIIFCQNCDAELEVISLKPVELDWPLDDYEDEMVKEYEDFDWDDDDDWSDDDDDFDD